MADVPLNFRSGKRLIWLGIYCRKKERVEREGGKERRVGTRAWKKESNLQPAHYLPQTCYLVLIFDNTGLDTDTVQEFSKGPWGRALSGQWIVGDGWAAIAQW